MALCSIMYSPRMTGRSLSLGIVLNALTPKCFLVMYMGAERVLFRGEMEDYFLKILLVFVADFRHLFVNVLSFATTSKTIIAKIPKNEGFFFRESKNSLSLL